MLERLNWPTALVLVGGGFIIAGLAYTGHLHPPTAVVVGFWGGVMALMPAVFDGVRKKLGGGQ